MNVTPSMITSLKPGEIFVFGSNLEGLHAGGAAKFALNFGAEWGNGVGIQGQTYAIPTLSHPGGTEEHMLKVSTIGKFVKQFIAYAKAHPENHFYVTPIGCGIAGFTPQQIAPLFKGAMGLENVSLPAEFIKVLSNRQSFSLSGLRNLISNSIKNVLKEELAELSGMEQRGPRIKAGSEEEQYILYTVKKNQDISHKMLYTIAKQLGCSEEAVKTVLRRNGILPKFASTANLTINRQ